MGNVIYTVDTNLIDLPDEIKKVNLILKFELGEIDFAANRESLSYKSRTIEAINNKLKKTISHIENSFNLKRNYLFDDGKITAMIRKCFKIEKFRHKVLYIFQYSILLSTAS